MQAPEVIDASAPAHAHASIHCPAADGWSDGITVVQAQMRAHALIGLGEIHQSSEFFAFLDALLDDPAIRESIDDVVVEFGNARYQPTLDRYLLELEAVPQEELARVWADNSESPTGPFDSPLYAGVVEHIRRINEASQGKRLRLVAADLPIDWQQVHSLEDYRAAGSRSAHLGQRVVDEVLSKNRRAILVFGGAHLSRHGMAPRSAQPMQTAANVIEQVDPNALYSINAVVGFGAHDKAALPRLQTVSAGCIAPLADHFLGQLPGPSVLREARQGTAEVLPAPSAGLLRRDFFDAYLWLGPAASMRTVGVPAGTYANEARWNELNRRSRIRFGAPLDPDTRATGELRPLAHP